MTPPAVNVTASTRCTNKNLFTSSSPGGGSTDSINATLQFQPSSGSQVTSGTVTLAMTLANDVLKVGNYYDVTIADGAAPLSAEEPHQGTPMSYAPPYPHP